MLTRRSLLKTSSLALGTHLLPLSASAQPKQTAADLPILLNLNESAFGPSPQSLQAIRDGLPDVSRYANEALATALTAQVAAREGVSPEQIVLGEVLDVLGLYFAGQGGPGGEFLYSSPGYLALIDAASRLGGLGVPVPLNAQQQNDLPALQAHINAKTRAIYLVNPHNPTGTVNANAAFKDFLREASRQTPIIVDEAYLEYLPNAAERSAVSAVQEGSNVIVFRTFDKIHGLAGLPMGYAVVPPGLGDTLRRQGAGDLEALGRLNLLAASAALRDQQHLLKVRLTVAAERQKWQAVLQQLRLDHTDAQASFIFFHAKRPQSDVASAMRQRGVVVGRAFPPYDDWVRITIGLPEQNRIAQQHLIEIFGTGSSV